MQNIGNFVDFFCKLRAKLTAHPASEYLTERKPIFCGIKTAVYFRQLGGRLLQSAKNVINTSNGAGQCRKECRKVC